MTTAGFLLDSNVLIAATVDGHMHHDAVDRWLAGRAEPFATCPITEGSLIREVLRGGDPAELAIDMLGRIRAHRRHRFWSDDVSYVDVRLAGIIGHKQVTDAYLARLARAHKWRLATLDKPMAALHADVAELVPTS